tara:strand:- start:67 stop:933 length:867 start_codon:yes stop_codon:yes gene_type:complete
MKFALIGGNTRWSKILIKNFQKSGHTLLFTSSNYIEKKNNYKNFKQIPIEKLDFIILSSSTIKNFKALKYFITKKLPLFVEKPITSNYKNFLEIKKLDKLNLVFVHYQHIYSDPINFLKKQFKKENLKSINIVFGKNGPYKNINSSYEWLPHPLSILFHLINYDLNLSTKYSEYISKKKTNIIINGNIKNKIFLNIQSGNNFIRKKYLLRVETNKKIYTYNAINPKEMIVNQHNNNKKIIYKFKDFPLESSIKIFNKILDNSQKKKIIIKYNNYITNKIMKYFYKYNL